MQRLHQFVFVTSVLALSWYTMMAVHEFGHVVGALATGGTIERVVLHPLTISRTDVSPNPSPSVVVWLGPILGCFIPLMIWWFVPRRFDSARSLALFFAGFCRKRYVHRDWLVRPYWRLRCHAPARFSALDALGLRSADGSAGPLYLASVWLGQSVPR